MRIFHFVFLMTLASQAFSERFTPSWVEENGITLEKLLEISDTVNAQEKFEIANILLDWGRWVFRSEKESSIDAARSMILHEAAAMGHARAQFILSLDYSSGAFGFAKNGKLAELWLKKAISNGYEHHANDSGLNAYYEDTTRFKKQKAFNCIINLETVTGLERTEIKNSELQFALLFEYEDFVMVLPDSKQSKQFRCHKTTVLDTVGPYLQEQCTNDGISGLAEYFFMADDRSGNKVGISETIPYTWVLGLPDLVTIRQGNCSHIPDFNFK